MAMKQQYWRILALVIGLFLIYEIAIAFLPQIIDNIENKSPENKTLPAIAFFDKENEKATLADFKGRVVLVNLWATWCTPCIAELPSLDRLQKELGAQGLTVVAINLDRDARPSTVKSFYEKRNIRHLKPYWDKHRQVPEKWRYDGIPVSYLLDRNGTLVEEFKGPYEWDKGEAFETVKKLLE